MRGYQWIRTVGMAAVMLVGLAASPLWAEDSNVFKNRSAILDAQEALEADGFLAHGDFTPGELDAATQKALSKYQSEHALNSRGVLDDDTYEMLTSHFSQYPWDGEVVGESHEEELSSDAGDNHAGDEELSEPAPEHEATTEQAELKNTHAASSKPAEHLGEEHGHAMPATGSPLPLLALSGMALIGAGLVLLRMRSV
jgi:LPXTG-motif cell wall-anchored protein